MEFHPFDKIFGISLGF